MNSLADRFRRWYEYERDCNAKSLEMLASVPVERRTAPEFQKAVDRMAHLVAARRRWLHRLGHWPAAPGLSPQGTALTDLSALVADTESAWVAYLGRLDDAGSIWWIGHGQRLLCNDHGLLMSRAPILAERRQRLRAMCQGPDGLLDVRTHEDLRALRSIGPAP